MSSVPQNHVCDILLNPFFKEIIAALKTGRSYIPALYPFSFWEFPLIGNLINNHKAQPVTKRIEYRRLRIMSHPYGIYPH